MAALVVKDDLQLRRIERAIAELEARPPAEQMRKQTLLAALYRERDDVAYPRSRPTGG